MAEKQQALPPFVVVVVFSPACHPARKPEPQSFALETAVASLRAEIHHINHKPLRLIPS